jgi:hypothetical protein
MVRDMELRCRSAERCNVRFIVLAAVALAACPHPPGVLGARAVDLTAARGEVIRQLVAKHGETERGRIERGVAQVATYWRARDGNASAFAKLLADHFVSKPDARDALFQRFEKVLEQLDGVFVEAGRELRRFAEVEVGPMQPVDAVFAAFDPSAHFLEDMFRSKLAFVALANFPLTTLEARVSSAKTWTRREWAEARLALRFARRVPASVQQEIAEAGTKADLYIADYNLHMHHVLGRNGERLFPRKQRLISHWNLRDEIKAQYAKAGGLERQRTIAKLMERIVAQEIPRAAINRANADWNPFTNTIVAAPPDTVDADGQRPLTASPSAEREPDERYARIVECFRAARKADPYSPLAPTMIARRFEVEREIPEKRFVQVLEEILRSPLLERVAKVISQRLGRPLEVFDIWYDGFRPKAMHDEAKLDAMVRGRYPTVAAFQADLPNLLVGLGFAAERARYLAERIVVDPSRGAGHALGASRREDKARLRTRIGPGGMDYKGFNIAVHELGHNVEQVFSLFDIDHTLLAGVPNTAFTEALAFVFQSRDLELLGLGKRSAEHERLNALHEIWQTYEIAGVGMVDLEVWRWLYANPRATAAELRVAAIAISKEVWNRYFARAFGLRDQTLLGIYSHMVSNFLYLPDYALGHIIAFQIESHLKQGGNLGREFERMSRSGAVTPDHWMRLATGKPISPSVMLDAAAAALDAK